MKIFKKSLILSIVLGSLFMLTPSANAQTSTSTTALSGQQLAYLYVGYYNRGFGPGYVYYGPRYRYRTYWNGWAPYYRPVVRCQRTCIVNQRNGAIIRCHRNCW